MLMGESKQSRGFSGIEILRENNERDVLGAYIPGSKKIVRDVYFHTKRFLGVGG